LKLGKKKILVIDDEIGPREAMRLLLGDKYAVRGVSSVEEGIQIFRLESYDLIITDIRMPGEDGISGLRRFREIDSDIPVIVVTGYGTMETARAAINLGASEYLKKPFDTSEFQRVIDRCFAESKNKKRMKSVVIDPSLHVEDPSCEVIMNLVSAFIHNLTNKGFKLRSSSERLSSALMEDLGGEGAKDVVKCVQDDVSSMMEALVKFRNAVGREPGVKKVVDFERLVYDFVSHVGSRDRDRITVEVCRGRHMILGDYELLWNMLDSLVQNALDAVNDVPGGMVTVVVSEPEYQKQWLVLNVSDNGPGLPVSDVKRIFSPDFSTKKTGLGVGLHLVRKAVEIHGGVIVTESQRFLGTSFIIKLPMGGYESTDY